MTGSAKPWDPERVVTPGLAADLIAHQFPSLVPLEIEPVGAGFDNTVYRVNGRWIFRFPRRTIAIGCLEQEIGLLPLLEGRLPLPVPVPRWIGRPEPEFPWPFLGAAEIPGIVAHRAGLTDLQRANSATTLARFLAALHSLPVDPFRAAGAIGDQLGRLDVAKRRAKGLAGVRTLVSANVVASDLASDLSRLMEAKSEKVPAAPPTLVHGDLYGAQLLVDPRGALVGVIDWGDIHVGHRAVDLAVAFAFLPPHAREVFFSNYGTVDQETYDLARFRAATHAVLVADYAYQTEAPALLAEAVLALRWATVP